MIENYMGGAVLRALTALRGARIQGLAKIRLNN